MCVLGLERDCPAVWSCNKLPTHRGLTKVPQNVNTPRTMVTSIYRFSKHLLFYVTWPDCRGVRKYFNVINHRSLLTYFWENLRGDVGGSSTHGVYCFLHVHREAKICQLERYRHVLVPMNLKYKRYCEIISINGHNILWLEENGHVRRHLDSNQLELRLSGDNVAY